MDTNSRYWTMADFKSLQIYLGGMMQRSGNLNLRCVVCLRPAWNYYYGAHACKYCQYFFVTTVIYRKIYFCSHSGNCPLIKIGVNENSCKFCRMDQSISKGMMVIKVGKYDQRKNSYYLKQARNFIVKSNPSEEPLNPYAVAEIRAFAKTIHELKKFFVKWMNRGHMQDYFVSLPRSRRIKCLERLVIMRIADDSVDLHDVLVLQDKYYIDPYLIPISSLQYVAIQILEMVRYVQDNSGEIDSVFHRFDETLLGELITYL
ncbi:peroxisome proliferator-activated receptor delta-like, partial [Centruroides sculpturatus]